MAERPWLGAWSRITNGWIAGVLVLSGLAGPAAQASTWSAAPSPADAKACGPLPSFPAGTALITATAPGVAVSADGDIQAG